MDKYILQYYTSVHVDIQASVHTVCMCTYIREVQFLLVSTYVRMCCIPLHYFVLILSSDLSVQFEQPQYTVSEGNTITVNVVASTDFSTPFSVDISHDGSGGELGCMYTYVLL